MSQELKYKVGDRVRVVSDEWGTLGKVGVVTEVDLGNTEMPHLVRHDDFTIWYSEDGLARAAASPDEQDTENAGGSDPAPETPRVVNGPKLVGIHGLKRTGKDTLGAALVGYGYTQLAFADPIKEFAKVLDPFFEDYGDNLGTILTRHRGWEEAKDAVPEVREFLQILGTEAGRTVLGRNVWVDAAMKRVSDIDGPVVITDVRFDNEAQAILDAGGIVVRVTRPGPLPEFGKDTHSSEAGITRSLITHDYVNDGTLGDLNAWAKRLADRK